MKLECPHCGDSFIYTPETGGTVASCRHCGLAIQLPTVAQLPSEKRQQLQAERQAALQKEQRQAERALKKAEGQRRREEREQERQQQAEAKTEARTTHTLSPSLPTAPSLVACPDCSHAVSAQASACPNCGRPMSAQTIEKTSKRFKAMRLIGGIVFMVGAIGTGIQSTSTTSSNASIAIWFLATLGGLLVYMVAKLLAWWYHG